MSHVFHHGLSLVMDKLFYFNVKSFKKVSYTFVSITEYYHALGSLSKSLTIRKLSLFNNAGSKWTFFPADGLPKRLNAKPGVQSSH